MTAGVRHSIVEGDLATIMATDLPWEQLFGRTALITGANGFLPAYMAETLLYLNEARGAGIKVVALVRDPARAATRFAAYAGRGDLQFRTQDLGQPLAPDLSADVIIHAASQASPKYYSSDPVGTLRPNVIGTANLLDVSRTCGTSHFLFLSSGEVYGNAAEPNVPVAEGSRGYVDPASVRSCYAESKRMAETMCVAWHHQYGVPAKIVRPFHTYGPGMRLDDGRVYADFVADIVQGRDIVMKSDGSARRAFCYLADAVAGFFTVMLRGKAGEAYNVGNSDAELSVLELAQRLVQLFPNRGLRVVPQRRAPGDTYFQSGITRNCPDTAKVEALGWKPTVGIDEGFSRTIGSYE